MADAKTYCDYVLTLDESNPHRRYHDTEYGFPMTDDNELFGRLLLEINQAGLSWNTILNKQEGFRRAYSGFRIVEVAVYTADDRARLLADASIIRNRLKVDAAIANAKRILELAAEYGSFAAWLDANHRLGRDEWVKLFKKTFRFTGGEITGEFLMSTGYLPGAHVSTCPVYHTIAALRPPWMQPETGTP